MNQLIESILSEIKEKNKDSNEWWNTKYELERILDSQFKVLRNAIEERDLRVVNLIHIGKIKPTKWFTYNRDRFIITKEEKNARYKEYYKRVEKPGNKEQGTDNTTRNREDGDL